VFTQPNAGKSEALRHGVDLAEHEALVFLDADTLFQRDTIRQLVAPLADPAVGAVSGHARVGNLRTFIARCQALEYICGFNLDRRAFDALDCITVAPGAVSAMRRTALREAGGFRSHTLAEDTDLTLCLHRCGYRIRYVPGAVAWTEAPETIQSLAKQRFRWCFGTMQCLWKHRDMLFNPKFRALGFFSLPSIWFFQIILVALTPMVDLLLLSSVLLGDGRAVLPYFVTFLLLDQFLAILACTLEREPWRRSWIMIPMRLIYRPLLSWVVWKSILSAARGVLVGWGKLERTASVTVPSRA
jgi:cellulose synthase/poly-beta-1,6-N-acetylglucosamine synthase-like glycosyltransferase